MTRTQAIGLVEVTSQTQANNGTQCFHDPITGCDYMSYESGYVRRKFQAISWRTGKRHFPIYQLNKKRIVKFTYNGRDGRLYNADKTERILEMNPEIRIDMVVRAAINYRNYLNK
jgi:hypothetical protein